MKTNNLILSLFALTAAMPALASNEVPSGPDLMKVCGSTNPLPAPTLEIVMRRWAGAYVYLDMTITRSDTHAQEFERKIGYVYDSGDDYMRIAIGHVKNGKFEIEQGQFLNTETVFQGDLTRGVVAYKGITDKVNCFLNFGER